MELEKEKEEHKNIKNITQNPPNEQIKNLSEKRQPLRSSSSSSSSSNGTIVDTTTKDANSTPTINANVTAKNADDDNDDDELLFNLTLRQKLNLFVYTSVLVAIAYVLNRDHNSVVTLSLVRMFPKEAKTLGFH
jgi:hypothetical protein